MEQEKEFNLSEHILENEKSKIGFTCDMIEVGWIKEFINQLEEILFNKGHIDWEESDLKVAKFFINKLAGEKLI